nr:immunoglobulin heavy chain junction region [Macaca mulatta]MOX14922.1 immunoglobulin heavy chain junction region [Macaca mulatta]MOX14996.1 immunoglobulin heavy chain junction region [Macaca mulatta]MOX15103.1 immunoglobulin heavy chain junction region [Macaca mulatta]MOX15249.1 immunoglobulin heavy chain junction region [Macaca mulatta]
CVREPQRVGDILEFLEWAGGFDVW